MEAFTKALAALHEKGPIGAKELADLMALAEKLGIKFHLKTTSSKFAELTMDGNVTAMDEKMTIGSMSLTLKLFH